MSSKDIWFKKSEQLAGYKYELKKDKKGTGFVLTEILAPVPLKGRKAKKVFKKLTAIIEVDGYRFQADDGSINYMSSVLAIANFKFNQAIANGVSPTDAYTTIYKQTIPWKDATNVFREITIEDIGNNLQIAMKKVKEIISEAEEAATSNTNTNNAESSSTAQ
jgi:hypothetical protein